MKNIVEILDSKDCCGCGACINACPTQALSFSQDDFGFVRPQIDNAKCIKCGKCIRTCPQYNEIETSKPRQVLAALNKNDSVVIKSSSGGIFYALAESVISEGGSAFGATLDDQFKVKHICVERVEDLPLLQKSKYVQSYMGDCYKQALQKLKEGKKVLFSGTPCQVAAMKSIAGDKYAGSLFFVDVVCHGVPSQTFWSDYLMTLSKKVGSLKEYIFCYKRKARNGMNKYTSFTGKRCKKFVKNWPQDSYNCFFMEAINYQEVCYSCKFARPERVSDLTICDYWHWDAYHKNDFPSCSTLSGICVNSDAGKMILDKIADKLSLVESSFDHLAAHNGCLLRPTPKPAGCEDFLQEWKSKGYEFIDQKFEKKNRLRILKNRLQMYVPEGFKLWFYRLRHGN